MGAEVGLVLGLTEEEREALRGRLGREPNELEWAMVDAEWSEHCSYKSSRPVLRQLPTEGRHVVIGPGFDAGVIDVGGDGYIVTVHIESHNHPSAVDPYGGAATGIGGVVRDILSMGTRPIALLDSLRFGRIDSSPHSRWLFKNVVRGIGDYGNCIGVPTIGGEVEFDESFEKNCLVDVVCIGLGRRGDLVLAEARHPGDSAVLLGGSTGRDGIHGVTFASKGLSEKSEEERSAVQIPHPFMKKLIIEATLEAVATGRVRGLKDLGGGGLTCGLSEMAYKGGCGIEVDISKIHLREPDLNPIEVMISESQERMLFIVQRGYEAVVCKVFEKYDLPFAVIGRVTGDGYLVVKKGSVEVARLPAETVAEAPVIERPSRRPRYLDGVKDLKPPAEPKDLSKALLDLLSSPTIASKRWVYEQYDHEVGVRTVIKPGQAGAAVLRLENGRLLAVKVDGKPKHCYLDPYNGAAGALAEACRNIVAVGGEPVAMVDHCQFGNPEDPEVFWTFKESVRGMAECCRRLNLPCVGGKVSFYNEDVGRAVGIKPSPVFAVLGLIESGEHIREMAFRREGEAVILLGRTRPEMGGSEYYEYLHRVTGGAPPIIDFNLEKGVQSTVLMSIRRGLVSAVNDCSDGGVAVALAEMCIAGGLGVEVDLDRVNSACRRSDEVLFSESHSRMIVTAERGKVEEISGIAESNGIPMSEIGVVAGKEFSVRRTGVSIIRVPVGELGRVWGGAVERYMGEEL